MIAAILGSRLFGPISAGIGLVLSIALLCTVASKAEIRHQLDRTEAARVVAVKDLAQCRVTTANQADAITRQNASIAALKTESDRRTAAAEKAAQQAHAAAVTASQRAVKIMSLTPGADMCASAFDVLRGRSE